MALIVNLIEFIIGSLTVLGVTAIISAAIMHVCDQED